MASTRERADRAVGGVVLACGLLVAGFLVWHLTGLGSDSVRTLVADGVYPPLAVVFTVLGFRAARHPGLDPRNRLAWHVIAAAFAVRLVAYCVWFAEDALLQRTAYPAVADYWFLAFDPIMVAGLLLLPGADRTRRDKMKLALDALIVGVGTFMVLWYLVLGEIFAESGATFAEIFFSAALPIGDLVLVLAAVTVLMRRKGAAGLPVRLLAASTASFVVADVYYTYVQLHVGFVGGAWPDLFWTLSCLLLIVAAQRQHQQADDRRTTERGRGTALTWLPYGAVALAYGMLGALVPGQKLYPIGGMIVGAATLTALVVARQMYALRENRDLAVTDTLTGLANRTLVTERLVQLSGQPLRPGRHSAVLLIDLDHFKPINDTYGHEGGDAVLRAVAAALRAAIRSGDVAGRLGGDEFAVIVHQLPTPEAAARIAERLVHALRTPVIFGDHLLEVQASVGVAVRDESSLSGEALLQHADTAMYAAKRSGRSRYVVYSAELDTRARDADLRRAITAGELVVHFQPTVDLATDRIAAVEALVRWQHPERGLLMPGEFIELAEETGAVVPLGEYVLRSACRQAVQWRTDLPGLGDLRLNVNLSPKQVVRADLVEVITTILAETGFPADRLVLEITEGVMLEPDPLTLARLERLRELGITLAVDDFGTGFSALSYLRLLPVSILKIDRSFVTDIADDRQACAVAEAVVRLGAAFRLYVVAEGVETAEQAAALRAMGCGYAQGYFFHRPADGATVARTLREDRQVTGPKH